MDKPSLLEVEFRYGIEDAIKKLPIFDVNNAIDERKGDGCLASAGSHYLIGLLLTLLSKHDEAEKHLPLCISFVKQGLSYLPKNERKFQYSLFRYALLLGGKSQVDESAKLISAIDTNIFRLYTHPSFEHAIANLWIKNDRVAEKYIQQVEQVEGKKQEIYLFPGVAKALTSVLEGNEEQLAQDLDEVLLQHTNYYAKYRYPLSENQLICESATFIGIIAKRRGLDVKPAMKNCRQILLLKPYEQSFHPSLKKSGRIEFTTDLMPEFVLKNWILN